MQCPEWLLLLFVHWFQLLEEMEKEFGISCSLGMPKWPDLEDLLDAEKPEAAPRNNLQEGQRTPSSVSPSEEEKNKVEKVAFN